MDGGGDDAHGSTSSCGGLGVSGLSGVGGGDSVDMA